MNKKTIIVIAVIIAIIIIAGSLLLSSSEKDQPENDTATTSETNEETTLINDRGSIEIFEGLKNATITAPGTDEEIVLINGEGSIEIEPGAASRKNVMLLDHAYATWQKGNRTDIATLLKENSGGSGTFYHLAIFDVQDNIFTKKSEVFLGDRIQVDNMRIDEIEDDSDAEYRITVQTLDREKDDTLSSPPTIERIRIFDVSNQELQEAEDDEDSDI